MSELLPCPFCGANAEVERSQERFDYSVNGGPDSVKDYGYYVYCTSCDASMGLINVPPNTSDGAIFDWNRRADDGEKGFRRGYLDGVLAALDYVDEGKDIGWLYRFREQVLEPWAYGDCSEIVEPPLPGFYLETDRGFIHL